MPHKLNNNFSNFDPIDGYKALNTIQPKYFQTQYPYSVWNISKLLFTQNKIEILVRKEDKLKHKKKTSKADKVDRVKKLGGSVNLYPVIIYH